MSNAVRKHGHGLIDLRKRRPGEHARAARARAMQAALPLHSRTSLRSRRRKLRVLAALAILFLAWGAVYGLSELSYLPRYAVQEVKVEGTENVPPRLVHAFVETKLNDGTRPLISRENIFLYPKDEIAEGVQNYFPRILSANISRESLLAQAITVSVIERKPFAPWCREAGNELEETGKECFEMDDAGFIFAPLEVKPKASTSVNAKPLTGFAQSETSSRSTSTGAVVFTGGLATSTDPVGQTFLPEQFTGVLTLLSRLKDDGLEASSVSVENEQDFSVSLSKGFDIRATFNQDASSLVRNLQVILSSESLRGKESDIEYIDLRFGNRVYYKNKAGSR